MSHDKMNVSIIKEVVDLTAKDSLNSLIINYKWRQTEKHNIISMGMKFSLMLLESSQDVTDLMRKL